jgi:23S rRNA (uracil1939-C5)-methyltransferase
MAEAGTNLDIKVEKLVYGGEGLSRVDGQVALTPFVLPGERASVAVEESKPGWLRTRLVELHEAAAERVDPRCPYFGRCGGCHYQHAAYTAQLQAKRQILEEVLSRVGKLAALPEIGVVAEEPWHYRNRSQFHLRGAEIGYLERRSHRLCAIDHCPISSPKLNETIATIRAMLRDPRWPRFIRSLEVFTNETDVQINLLETARPVARRFFDWCAERIAGYVSGAIDYAAAGFIYRISARSFFQVNRYLVEALIVAALEGAEGDTALDLFAGAGLFSLPMSRRFRETSAVEAGAAAVCDLIFNCERAGRPVRAVHSGAEEYVRALEVAPDFVLLDPPRAGIGPRLVEQLARLRPRHVTIVACDPATLARDLRGLVDAGYRIDRLTLVDLFPQTFHLETVARLVF